MINKISEYTKKPKLYEEGTRAMWTDPHISKMLLETHLNDNVDLASRKGATIDLTVNWILKQTPEKKLNILDLGCGPGLYTKRFAEKGHRVKGVDFSTNSIQYARNSAKEKGLSIDYECCNYLHFEDDGQYDLVMMIFTDFGVLTPPERSKLLFRVKSLLKPDGIFLFDVLNLNCIKRVMGESKGAKVWDFQSSGFWKDSPYIVLSDSFFYEEDHVALSQHLVIDENENVDVYRFWINYFSESDLNLILDKEGFLNMKFFYNLLPADDFLGKDETTFCICGKRT